MKGYFKVSRNSSEEFDIICELDAKSAKEPVSESQKTLYLEVENATSVIKSLQNTSHDVKKKYFDKLFTLTQAGLMGETAQPELAMKSLVKLKNEMVMVEGQRIKNDYMKMLGVRALIISIVSIATYYALLISGISEFGAYFLAVAGSSVGTWLSFGARKFTISFEELSVLEEDMMSPWIRLLYIGACSAVFILLLNTQLISLGVGTVSTVGIMSQPELQIAVGVLCGLVESKIGVNIYKRAVTLIESSDP